MSSEPSLQGTKEQEQCGTPKQCESRRQGREHSPVAFAFKREVDFEAGVLEGVEES